jgi:hypothetical protein
MPLDPTLSQMNYILKHSFFLSMTNILRVPFCTIKHCIANIAEFINHRKESNKPKKMQGYSCTNSTGL